MNYETAKTMFETTRKRKLANNTYLVKIWDTVCVEGYGIELHENLIVKFYPGKTILNTCGWFSRTTKARFNDFTKFLVFQKNFVWYVSDDFGNVKTFDNGIVVLRKGKNYV